MRHWLIRHSMASTAIYSSCEYGAIKDDGPSLDSGKPVAILHRFIPSKFLLLQHLFNLPLVAKFCLISTVSVLGQEFADYTSPCLPQ